MSYKNAFFTGVFIALGIAFLRSLSAITYTVGCLALVIILIVLVFAATHPTLFWGGIMALAVWRTVVHFQKKADAKKEEALTIPVMPEPTPAATRVNTAPPSDAY